MERWKSCKGAGGGQREGDTFSYTSTESVPLHSFCVKGDMETVAGIQIVQGEWTECYGTLPVSLREKNLTLKIQPNTSSLTHSLKQYRGFQSPLNKQLGPKETRFGYIYLF